MADTEGDKTQEATPHRRQQAREEGQVARSQDLASAALLLAGLAMLLWMGGSVVEMLRRYTTAQIGGEAWISADPQFITAHAWRVVSMLGAYVLPLFGLLMVAGVAANFLQVGFMFLPDKLAPDLSRLDPLQGFARIFSLASLVRLVMGLLKMAVVGSIAYACLYGERETILGMAALPAPAAGGYLAEILLWTGIKIAGALVGLAVLDYGFQWWKHEQDLRMTTQQVREELKNLEANPQMVGRRKQVQRELAMHRVSAA
jgi:flagellar biosynthetic protein FlhB